MIRISLIALAVSAALLGLGPAAASAATITVNSTADTAADDNTCTLREAIDSANDNVASGAMANECAAGEAPPTGDVIEFSIAGAGPHVIAPTSNAQGNINEAVEIDGTEGGPGPNIEIDGSGLTFPAIFVEASGADSYIHDIAVYDVTGVSGDGIRSRAANVTFENLLAGIDIAGTAHGNGGDGIEISGDNNDVLQSLSSDNGGAGIRVTPDAFVGTGGANTTIAGNRIGTTLAGTAGLGNDSGGIVVTGTPDDMPDGTVIGGPLDPTPGGICDGDCNLISANTGDGISVAPGGTLTGLQIRGNYVGTGIGGLSDLGNTGAGMHLTGGITGAVVRNNLIAGNTGNGLEMFPGATTAGAPSNTTIAGNRIGVDREGDDPLGNDARGVVITATVAANLGSPTANVIGGTTDPTPGGACDGDCNVISGNGLDGIELFGSSLAGGQVTGTQVLGNHIGVAAAGTSGVDNNQWGVVLGGVTNTVIGSAQAPNVISGNSNSGMLIQENAAGGNVVQSNLIGLGSDGVTEVANGESGIAVFSGGSGVLVGGTAAGQGNTIARNTEAGVAVAGLGSPSASVPILGNSIHTNPGLGIDLMPDGITFGVTPNDGAGDPDDGGNGLLNFPRLDSVAVADGSTYVLGDLDSVASTRFRIELFANATADPSGHGEGQTPVGAFEVTTNAAGHALLQAELPGGVAAGQSVSATSTQLDGAGAPLRTSEFSDAVNEACDITGTGGNDTLTGTAAAEIICGQGGDDTIEGGGGDDLIIGGAGTDTSSYAAAAAPVTVDLAAETATGAGSDLLRGIENATGSAAGDQLTARTAGSVISGLAGNDTLIGAGGPDSLDGGDGDDAVTGADENDTLTGGTGDDAANGGAGDDVINGGDANDTLTGGTGTDVANGGAGDDAITGDDGDDTLGGGDGNDSVDGGAGADSAGGDAGDDEVLGQADDDELFGGDGSDTVKGSGGRDDLEGGAGEDTVTAGGGDKDEARGQGGDDTIKGGGGKKDDVRGGGGEDRLDGGGGKNDECDGGGGTDLTPAPGCESEKSIP